MFKLNLRKIKLEKIVNSNRQISLKIDEDKNYQISDEIVDFYPELKIKFSSWNTLVYKIFT